MKKGSILVVFGGDVPKDAARRYEKILKGEALGALLGAGSIYEANALLEELAQVKLPDGRRVAKAFTYKGFELWWIHYNSLYLHFCLSYTQHKKLLEYLTNFKHVTLFNPPHKGLFLCYLSAHSIETHLLKSNKFKTPTFLPFGVFLQIIFTLISVPILACLRKKVLVYTGDKFERNKDYDFRMKFVYEEMRKRGIPFVEFIRGIESWKNVISHAWTRRRPVVYADGILFLARFLSAISGGHRRARKMFGPHLFSREAPENRFKLLLSTQFVLGVYDDIWAIKIASTILRMIGVRTAFIPAGSERSFHTLLATKIRNIPSVGILHGAASRFYNTYDFMPGFDGSRSLSVGEYGLWSEWWREYYTKYSKVLRPEQLVVSGPMRPYIAKSNNTQEAPSPDREVRVLFVSEQLAVPAEAGVYLEKLLEAKDVSVFISFRVDRDGFENWLKANRPDILAQIPSERIIRTGIMDALAQVDVAVGSHSTGVLEALYTMKCPIFYETSKWGDYFNLREHPSDYSFIVASPEALVEAVKAAPNIPQKELDRLKERFFGDPTRNGSKWVVDELEKNLNTSAV
ncbi:MAG: hypothetical protein A3J09_00130 [Candidatus Zambryskibacteria bacterium RIFCSPLOWO2_02_FULL_51_21]|uniref:Uncharacterized protein n=1 Tax=Candidatus Zambryskibacteria bacterium RIFCSPHIGHO2_02_FULL_43_37 TaxID=1802749 RepID=A0A1G2TIH3_9BACT|nr:MAG: hypothetical protein A2723_00130 [Candidatus Zambryskibacteria bacterium RIFCSPHIGHO2_01_FULL_52_18]OHA96868.1 MAG: hypothetical protein A3D49_02030 [Candidatus Zambryskibacteria bacterium RIFCSPHIGHO2_02_FULL_43_37]OHB07073.1 MAG: hypothetical protein A2944_02325 [Candidatus Zambryskibacteria bacterium RIFCSPLOWO2_01_FULL_52_12]OHB10980.1 MAG: hypothetical protein A3J09_00130 [Candidatus Zambryskibacteria bacterium RIFCSPLOWO2_02_FULL_51_21]